MYIILGVFPNVNNFLGNSPKIFCMSKFSQRLKELRLEKGLTQKELADVLNTNNSSICDWECGRTEPSIEMLLNICRFFEVSADFLLGLED